MAQNNDYELFLFYYAYQTFTKTADDIIAQYGLNRQHHRFLFFINKLPGITTKQLLKNLEISKQGSHATLKLLKSKGYIYDKVDSQDRRLKRLFPTSEGSTLIDTLTHAQKELFNQIKANNGSDWYAIMEGFAEYRQGYKDIKHLKQKIDEGEEC
ncbi:MarR family winged helix-turn-helix transcriptional regulator [Staphylococcus canis]|uniref:Winged helix-turn-helix transcriptional regulator n=1 Tax=Staphylococcus canis TaxID=2724942 RepID=A0ABS0T6G5_9STAP|nr:MarR family winged helix-turn-helix transcriptional regulator [Staphylococcus canis]MBI5974318.1 winged helix-turn-helix transcriptional regulator [Staphylococcus canis]